MMQSSMSPLNCLTPSPKLSERVTSPLAHATNVTPSHVLSPSKSVGIGATWSAALDEQLNRPRSDFAQNSSSKEVGKENIAGSQTSKIDHKKSAPTPKSSKIILEREILTPEMVK